ncbi:MAG: TIGR02710 family CRISPR-associated CARF protein [Nanoarchaeota archaeon]|nr:TIGR02710 family CRISPR-associated CARF protein [Nanoarchaeota archaeon]
MAEPLEKLREEWLDLVKKASIEKAEEMYWKSIFPLVEDNFIKISKSKEQYEWLVLPCGLESSYYILLINAIKPKNVYFIGTKEFKENFLNFIVEKTGLKPSQYIIDTVSYEGLEIADVYQKIRSHLSSFIDKKVLMDLTRGKRIMSVGAGIVGAFFGFDLVYIDEEWLDDIKRGMPGTERLVMVKNPFDVFGDLELKEARDFFNHNNHGAALSLYKRIHQKIDDPRNVEIEELLAESYLHWNSFNFKAALIKLESARDKLGQYRMKVNPHLIANIQALQILISQNDTESKNSEQFNLHVIIDLYSNALRKAEVGLFEDSISRLYRVLELISQYRLAAYGIVTSSPEIKKYELAYKALVKEIYGFEKELPAEIGLKDGYILLFLLQDYLIEGYSVGDLKKMFGVIRARDMSIIAHGLQLAGEKVFSNINQLAKTFIKQLCDKTGKDFGNMLHQHTFVKL